MSSTELPVKKITKDAKIDIRVPSITRQQADILAAKSNLTLSTWLQLVIEKEYKNSK